MFKYVYLKKKKNQEANRLEQDSNSAYFNWFNF